MIGCRLLLGTLVFSAPVPEGRRSWAQRPLGGGGEWRGGRRAGGGVAVGGAVLRPLSVQQGGAAVPLPEQLGSVLGLLEQNRRAPPNAPGGRPRRSAQLRQSVGCHLCVAAAAAAVQNGRRRRLPLPSFSAILVPCRCFRIGAVVVQLEALARPVEGLRLPRDGPQGGRLQWRVPTAGRRSRTGGLQCRRRGGLEFVWKTRRRHEVKILPEGILFLSLLEVFVLEKNAHKVCSLMWWSHWKNGVTLL